MFRNKRNIWIISIAVVIAVVAFTSFSGEKSIVNSYGYKISKKDSQRLLSNITSYYDAISEHNVQEMVKYTISNEPDGRIEFLEKYFENDFDLTINNLEIAYDYPKYPKGDFDNEKIDNKYKIEKAVVLKSEFTIESNEVYGVLGLDVGYHKLYLYVVKIEKEDDWQIVDMSTIDPFRE